MPDDKPVLRASAVARINGIQTDIEILIEPEDDGKGLFGVVGLSACPGLSLVSFLLQGDNIEFVDLPGDEADRALGLVFGISPFEARGHCCDLAARMILGMVLEPHPAQQQAAALVH